MREHLSYISALIRAGEVQNLAQSEIAADVRRAHNDEGIDAYQPCPLPTSSLANVEQHRYLVRLPS